MARSSAAVSVAIIVNACIWGFTIIMCSHALKGTGAYAEIQNILAGGAIMSLITVGGGLAALSRKLKPKE